MSKNAYQFAQTHNGRSVCFHCVSVPTNPNIPFHTTCGLWHDQWVFVDKIEAVAPCKRCFGKLSFESVMQMYGGHVTQ